MLSAIISAFTCVFARAALSVCDRKIFKKETNDFVFSLFLNALFPFLLAIVVAMTFGEGKKYFFSYFLTLGMFLSAFSNQIASGVFSHCFRTMAVKSIVAISKATDLFIPLIIFFITKKFKLHEYSFSCLSVAAFSPICFQAYKSKSSINVFIASSLMLSLFFQVGVNTHFSMNKIADTWPKFFSLMSCILLWRTIFASLLLFFRWLRKEHQIDDGQKKEVEVRKLFLRSFLAFTAQSAFFYSITRASSVIAWPILNLSPSFACLAAHLLLKERIEKVEAVALVLFFSISILYIFFNWY